MYCTIMWGYLTTVSKKPCHCWVLQNLLLRTQPPNRPLCLVSSTVCGGKIGASPSTKSGLITHMNFFLLFARPQANSSSCWGLMTITLPKFTYTTELGSSESNHLRHSHSSFHLAIVESAFSTSCSKAWNMGIIIVETFEWCSLSQESSLCQSLNAHLSNSLHLENKIIIVKYY